MSVVGVSSHVITDRNPATPPRDQIKEAQELATTIASRHLQFTYQVRLLLAAKR